MWPVKIISLKDDPGRFSHLVSVLRFLEIDYEFFDAVDGRTGLPPSLLHLVDENMGRAIMGRAMSNTEIACALSHLKVYEEIVRNGYPGAVVFEDDAVLSEGDLFAEFINNAVFEKNDFYQLAYAAARVWRFGLGKRKETRRLTSERLVYNASYASAYTLSRRAAKFILERAYPVRCVADWPCDLGALKPRLIQPKLVGALPTGGNSYLHNDRQSAEKTGALKKNPRPRGYAYGQKFLSKTKY